MNRRAFLRAASTSAGAVMIGGAIDPVARASDRSRASRRDVSFASMGAELRGWFYEPPSTRPWPVIVMAHGFTATRHMTADKYAESLCERGAAVLLYDHLGFGDSGGSPRLQVNQWVQARGYRDAMTCAASQGGVDAGRIALWGDSLSAGVAFAVASVDPRVTLLLLQCPGIGATLPPNDPDGALFAQVRATLLSGEVTPRDPSDIEGPIPVVSENPDVASALPQLTAYRWFTEYGGRPGSGWVNQVTRARPKTPVAWHPGLCAPHVECPTLMVMSPSDEIRGANPAVTRDAYARIRSTKELHEIDGGHFGLLYYPSATFETAIAAQASFLARHLVR